MSDDLVGCTISAADFIRALKRYREEAGIPATSQASVVFTRRQVEEPTQQQLAERTEPEFEVVEEEQPMKAPKQGTLW